MSARVLPESVLEPQRIASDPAVSAWVAANAGSGKTHVLAQRVIRLLLDDVPPAKILCITFTKAAAANMATRVFDTLAEWTRLDDAALDEKLRDVGAKPGIQLRARARQLFALALETPGGLKVQTIHAFCTRLLHQFPFEADVAARFTVLDETTERQLLDQLSLGVMLEASAKPDSPLGRALSIAIASAADQTFREVVGEAIRLRDAILKWRGHAGDIDGAIAQLSRALGLGPEETTEAIEAEFFSASHLPEAEWPAVMAALAEGSKNDQAQAERLAKVQRMGGRARVDAYLTVFCNADFEPRKNIITRATVQKFPALADRFAAEQARVCGLLDKRRAAICRDRSAALLRVADAVIGRYAAEKARRGLLDYDDLIEKTLALFANTSAAWVLYKLDLGIDHVLIDEAQDTSSQQWEIIEKLVGEFTAGAGARSVRRTLFAVGDDKQSIFSFQGAAPQKFDEMHHAFARAFAGAELRWEAVKLQTSFRSGENILGAVDVVFNRPEAYRGLSAEAIGTAHQALQDTAPGNVEIWEPMKPDERAEVEGWDAPFDTQRETTPRVRLARKIARHVGDLLSSGTPIGSGSKRRPVRAGDILILVRQRGSLFEAIIRALKAAHIEVAGADRLVLTEHIAVMDLIALADALLLPEDELALATVLKSPLFRLSEEQLFSIAWGRKVSLRTALLNNRNDLLLGEMAARLDRCAQAARSMTPFGFYAWLLGPEGGRKRILARLGHEAADALDEFLNLALDYESRETPSLQGFVAWLRAARAEVKRDMELARDEVRVMTVHGAKGLEAPVVYLADTMTPPAGLYPPRLLRMRNGETDGVPDCIAWAVARRYDVPPLRNAREQALGAAEDEYRRLLYVAMTRAADRLIVCGAEGVRRRPKGCWYDLIFEALAEQSIEIEDSGEKLWRYRRDDEATTRVAAAPEPARAATVIPAWLHCDAPAEKPDALAVTPSGLLEDDPVSIAAIGIGAGFAQALARGRLVHRLMQSLPDIPAAHRAEAARHHTSRRAQDFTAEDCERIVKDVLAILGDARFAPLFGPGSRAEVPIVGHIARPSGSPLAVSGQIDRLAITPDAVLIADYKTNRPAPRRLEEVPPPYIRQLALYRALLTRLYPDRPVRAALVWTDAADLMEIPAETMDAALSAFTSR